MGPALIIGEKLGGIVDRISRAWCIGRVSVWSRAMKESSNGNYDFRLALDNVHRNLINPVVQGIAKTMGEIGAIVRVRGDQNRAPVQVNGKRTVKIGSDRLDHQNS